MKPEILMTHVLRHAERTLLANDKEVTPESLEAQGRWLFSLYHAQDMHELTWKDMAEMFMDGIPATGSVHEECVATCDPDEEVDMSSEFLTFIETI